MRIAIIADSVDIQNAGIHVYTRNMVEALQEYTPHEIICIRQGARPDIVFKNDVVVKPFFKFMPKDPLRIFISIPRKLKNIAPDIVIEPAHFGPFNLPAHIKRITVIHDLTPIKFPQWHPFFSQVLQRLFMPRILNNARLIITNSQNTLSDLQSLYSFTQQKSVAVYPGNDCFFENCDVDFDKQPYFLFTGTIEPRKNLVCLLKAYKEFRLRTGKTHKLVIVGKKGWKSKDFFERLKSHPNRDDIELKGYVSKTELRDLYRKTTAFIYPSLYEGFGLPVLEAMGCGAPCLCSGTSSISEAGGDAALYFSPFNSHELAGLMADIANNKTRTNSLIKKGQAHAAQFTWKKFAEEFDRVLKSI